MGQVPPHVRYGGGSYTSIYTPKSTIIQIDGYALVEDEMDDEVLKLEADELLRRQKEEENKLSQYIKEQQLELPEELLQTATNNNLCLYI